MKRRMELDHLPIEVGQEVLFEPDPASPLAGFGSRRCVVAGLDGNAASFWDEGSQTMRFARRADVRRTRDGKRLFVAERGRGRR